MVEGNKSEREPTAGEVVVQTEKVEPVQIEKPRTDWTPETKLGTDVLEGKIKSIDEIFDRGMKITESGIVDFLMPDLATETVLIGGSTGKGGGIRRTPTRRTARMHKSGRRYRMSAMVIVGNNNGYVGIGLAHGPTGKQRDVVKKAVNKAKLNLIPVRRGCGSWECGCGGPHSVPFAVTGKSGSVRILLKPAPKGIGLCVSNEVKKVMRLAGIRDIWCKTRGESQTRVNFIKAAFNALKRTDAVRVQEKFGKPVGLAVGRVG